MKINIKTKAKTKTARKLNLCSFYITLKEHNVYILKFIRFSSLPNLKNYILKRI